MVMGSIYAFNSVILMWLPPNTLIVIQKISYTVMSAGNKGEGKCLNI